MTGLSESFPAKVSLSEGALADKKSKFTDQQIAFALQQAEGGTPVEEVCRKMGISQATFFRWKKVYGGLMPSEVRKLKQLREENARLRKLVADLTLDKEMLTTPRSPLAITAQKAYNSATVRQQIKDEGTLPIIPNRSPQSQHVVGL